LASLAALCRSEDLDCLKPRPGYRLEGRDHDRLDRHWRDAMAPAQMTIWMVEQFGLAINPWWVFRADALTSGTTSGTLLSMRKALLLSMTTAPSFTARGA